MSKKQNIDFVIYEDDDEQIIFRFYPRKSSCHSFNDKPPTKWEEVYKVYYYYEILRIWNIEEDETNNIEILFNSLCDECSVMDGVANRIKHIIKGEKTIIVKHENKEYVIKLFNEKINTFADGVEWIINKINNIYYEIVLWNSNNMGYKIHLKKEQLKKFGEYLEYCCEYMLEHGEPI